MSLCMQKERLTGFVLHIIQLVVIFVPFFIHKHRVVLYLLIVFYNLLKHNSAFLLICWFESVFCCYGLIKVKFYFIIMCCLIYLPEKSKSVLLLLLNTCCSVQG